MKQKLAYEITIDSDRSTIAQVVFVLVSCVACIFVQARNLALSRVPRQSPVAVLIPVGCLIHAIKVKDVLLKLAFVFVGVQSLARLVLAQAHAPYHLKRLAAMGGAVLEIIGLLLIIFAIVKWLHSVIYRMPIAKPEETSQ
jgi:hypothetical protein